MRTQTTYETRLAQERSPISVSSPPASHLLPTLALKLPNWALLMLRGRDLRGTSNGTYWLQELEGGGASGGAGASVWLAEPGAGGLALAGRMWVPEAMGRRPLCHLLWRQVSYLPVKMEPR